jgi:hypothetical protein
MRYVWTISLIAAMGGLLFGYDFVVIGGAKPFFEKYFQLNSEWLSGWRLCVQHAGRAGLWSNAVDPRLDLRKLRRSNESHRNGNFRIRCMRSQRQLSDS